MNRKTIVFITTGLSLGGAETMLFQLLREMDRDKFSPVVVSLMDKGKFGDIIAALDVPVVTIGMRPGRPSIGGLLRLVRVVRAARPDLIQGWMYHGNLAAQLVGLSSRVPVCCCVHNSFNGFESEKPFTRLAIVLTARLARYARRIVFVSYASQLQHEALGFPAATSCVIPNGVDPGMFRPCLPARKMIRDELGLPQDAIIIGLIGRYHPQKDHGNFLRAAAILHAKYPNVHFVLAGTGVENKNDLLLGLVRLHNLTANVHLLGERDDMPRLTASMDIITSSSSYGEAHSLAIVEAMASGVACVVTDVGDSAILVGNTGRVVAPKDAEGLALNWEHLLSHGPDQWEQLRASARQRVLEHYSLNRAVRSYEELYLTVN